MGPINHTSITQFFWVWSPNEAAIAERATIENLAATKKKAVEKTAAAADSMGGCTHQKRGQQIEARQSRSWQRWWQR